MDAGPRDNYVLDYVPGKMAIVALWTWHERTVDPTARYWRPSRMQPMLWVNTIIELFGCVAIFLYIRPKRQHQRCGPLVQRQQRIFQHSQLRFICMNDTTLARLTQGKKSTHGLKKLTFRCAALSSGRRVAIADVSSAEPD